MSRFIGQVFGVVREIGVAIDAGHAIRLGLPVSEEQQRRMAPRSSR